MSKDLSNFNILLVDDETDLGEVCVEILQMNGYKVSYFSNATEALNSITHSQSIQLLITDINMSQISGTRLFSEINKRLNTKQDGSVLPVIFMSGQYESNLQLVDPCTENIFYLAKPFQINDLINQVSHIYQLQNNNKLKVG